MAGGPLSSLLDGIHSVATAPVKLVESMFTPPTSKAKKEAKSAKQVAAEILSPKPAKVKEKRAELAVEAAKVKAEPKRLKLGMLPKPVTEDRSVERALDMVQRFLEPQFDRLSEAYSRNLRFVHGLSEHVEDVERELLGRITFVEEHVRSIIEDLVQRKVGPLEDAFIAFARGVAQEMIENDTNVSVLDKATMKAMFSEVKTAPALVATWRKYQAETGTMWAKLKAGAPQWALGMLATGAIDSSMLAKSRNLRFEGIISLFIAFVWGNSPPTWAAAGAIPVISLLRQFFGVPTTATVSADIVTSSFAAGVSSVEIKVTAVPDVLSIASDKLECVEARLYSTHGSYRLEPAGDMAASGADWSAGRTLRFTLPTVRITAGDTMGAAKAFIVLRGTESAGYPRLSEAFSTPRPVVIA